MPTTRLPCATCGTRVLPSTLERTGGLCRPCFKKQEAVQTSQVFISYRRTEATVVTRMLRLLESALPRMTFFVDTARLESGRRWSDDLYAGLTRSHALLVVVGPTWASSFERSRRETDVMLREIEWGLEQGRALLPVLVSGATMPDRTRLPEPIRRLHQVQAVTVRADDFEAGVAAIAQRLPTLVTEYKPNYSSGILGSTPGEFQEPKPSEWSGTWETRVGLPDGQELRLEFRMKEGTTAVTGTVQYPGERTPRTFTADWSVKARKLGGTKAVFEKLVLDGFIPGRGRFRMEIPVLEKSGDAYVGVNDQGWNFWSRRVEPGW